jgi:hypothetical protein
VTDEEYSAARLLGMGSIVRHDAMNVIGKYYFGEEFFFPLFLECEEIGPVDTSSVFYTFTIARGGLMSFEDYFITDIIERENTMTATFLTCSVLVNPDDATISDITFRCFKEDCFDCAHPLSKQIYPQGQAKEYPECYDYCYLSIPQEKLGTITVTFEETVDGRLVAAACHYNRV